MSVRIAPSILSADFAHLAGDVALVERGGADWLHIDVMDGCFVPNLTFGAKVIETVRRVTDRYLDCHLMVVQPEKYFEDFARAGASGITIHAEAAPHLHRQIHHIRSLGLAAGVALNPATPLTMVEEVAADLDLLLIMTVNPGFGGQQFIEHSVDKVSRARLMLSAAGSGAALEVDGGIARETIHRVWRAGADTFVAGNAIFSAQDPAAEVAALRALRDERVTLARQWAIVGGVVVLLGTGVLAATHFLAAELFPVSVGSKAPAFSAPTIQEYDSSGRTTAPPDARAQHSLADYRGQVLLINVWATWCQPCIVEMPAIEKLHQVYGPKGLKVVAISVDDQGMDDAIRSFVREHRLTFTVLHDEHGHVQHDYQATGYPETFVVGRDGTIRKKVIGAMNWNSASNRALVAQLLAEPAPAE